ncbi:MAG: hypothetical protein JW864_12885 [Spirochaetes bacterium]|nr:hypothetical protein [Spirochaetota bacterium]
MNLKADGSKLTGTYDSMTGPVPIKNSKIEGNKISFDLTLDIMGDKVDFKYQGKVAVKTMDITWTRERGTTSAVITCK